ncbi:hypothetical protein FHT78_005447 [Rhizobium sp. BK196]|uniref:hypothetical protein n=1 Tax=Rhizobium sp. BK196 TaxID=2587073 RepID=UPI0016084C22|nr:hypothetical protein [Rhizobium sp. BK196]MBB3313653.1 hypothetical protein [Rhizobium sp. BK196]
MTMIERIAAFLKDRDECLTPDEADDAERIESAREILRAVIGPERSIDLAEILAAIGEESMIMQPGITMTMKHEPRPKGACRACGATQTLRGKPLTGRYCSPRCREAGPSRYTGPFEVRR